ncbi:winged helix-turn-helix transcriptional regulator [Kordiimonas sp.]|uniref:winged helix-turn-helix transcriptional regulator n=1 Tax=Kordiimonas sp. TaxID=1970157 RepID=UPI003A9319C0
MHRYGQFCPIAKATELLGERWTFLIVRELLVGSRRFNEIQRGLGGVSPALLTRRLKAMEENGLLYKIGSEYFPSDASTELHPILMSLGEWGLKWAKSHLTDEDYDVEFLMHYLRLSIVPERLPAVETVLKFKFLDIDDNPNWWLLVKSEEIDICIKDPGKNVDMFFTTTVRLMSEVWMGQRTYREVISSEDLMVVGNAQLMRTIPLWLTNSPFSKMEPEELVTE